ncbi:MAG TPA: hypothetical protein VNO17_08385, partial [Actinomycetota bacterium]|nr:hypothetical protein [Actinomycetota bacterium]
LRDERLRRWRAHRALALRRQAHFRSLVLAYCGANVRAREDRRTPPALAEPPPVPLAACSALPSSADDPPRVVMVLFDVSESTGREGLRQLYLDTFRLVLRAVDGVDDPGAVLGADVIDDNPLAHGRLPINARFEPCTVLDNRLECQEEREAEARAAEEAAQAILARARRGTDVVGGLALAELFFQAHPEGERYLVICSDMLQVGRGIRLAEPGVLDGAAGELLERLPTVDLSGARVYVAGAGASRTDLSPGTIEAVEAFWRAYFQRAGAEVVLYGPALPRFP